MRWRGASDVVNQGTRPLYASVFGRWSGQYAGFFELPTQPPMGHDPNTPDSVQHIAFKLKDYTTLLAFKGDLEE